LRPRPGKQFARSYLKKGWWSDSSGKNACLKFLNSNPIGAKKAGQVVGKQISDIRKEHSKK
jgi:hypothetical protein